MHDQIVGKDRQLCLFGKVGTEIAKLQIQHPSAMRADRVLVLRRGLIVIIRAVRGTDAAGNFSETSYTVNNIDTTAPVLHASQIGGSMTNGNVTVNVTSDDPDAPIYYLISTEAIYHDFQNSAVASFRFYRFDQS